jgi:hypothetical protein
VNSEPPLTAEIRTLAEAAIDGRLDESQCARLDELLVSDSSACLAYVQYMSMLAGMRHSLVGPPAFVGKLADEVGDGAGAGGRVNPVLLSGGNSGLDISTAPQTNATANSFLESTLGLIADCFRPHASLSSRAWLLALVVVASGVAILLMQRGNEPLAPRYISIDASAPQIAGADRSGQPRIPSNRVPTGLSDSGINSLKLQSGTAKFWIANVGWVTAEGPVDFDLVDPMRARLNRGRIAMRVSETSGRGFVVETPYGEVTDLGTEFGLHVSDADQADLVVFEGQVDLRPTAYREEITDFVRVERLVGGEGVRFGANGQVRRLMSIVTGSGSIFDDGRELPADGPTPVILDVTDNLPADETRNYYEIVRGGFSEDARCYVDRAHEWNGIDSEGMPKYLIGADYVKTFNCSRRKRSDMKITIYLRCPSKVYVIFDDRLPVPKWLTSTFRNTGDKVGMDGAAFDRNGRRVAIGAGSSIDDRFSVWERVVSEAGKLTLGYNSDRSNRESAMYGIVAVPLNPTNRSDNSL